MLALYRGDDPEVARLRRDAQLDVHEAAALGEVERLSILLDEDATRVSAWSVDGAQPLHFAAFFGQLDACRLLLARGADASLHAQGFNGVAPIHAAAAGTMDAAVATEIVALLLARGADAAAEQGGGATALHAAAVARNAELARLLLDHGADPDAAMDDGRTPRRISPELLGESV
jgi:uncharacterized protein